MTLHMTRHQTNGITVLALRGHLVMGEESQQLQQQVQKLVDENQTNVVMLLDDVAYVDSFGVGELVSCLTLLKKHGGALKLANLTEFVREVLHITHLDKVIPIFENESQAIHSFVDGGDSTTAGGQT